ncbi:MAG: MutS family DNA mismatch repair protein [Gemmatimonadota bacterium]
MSKGGEAPPAAPWEAYRQREAEHRAVRDQAHRASLRLASLRAVTFLAAVAAYVVFDVQEGTTAAVALAVLGVLVVLFMLEVAAHRRARRRERWHEELRLLAHEGQLRLDRRWDVLADVLPSAERSEPPIERDHPYARDLDVAGRASLLRLLGPVTTERGRAVLRGWLLGPSDPTASRRRQEAVRELAPVLDARIAFTAHGRLGAPDEPHSVQDFLAWAEDEPWVMASMRLRVGAWMVPPVLVVLLVGYLMAGWAPFWVLVAGVQAWLLRGSWGRIRRELQVVEDGGMPLRAYVPQVRVMEGLPAESAAMADIRRRLASDQGEASAALARLARLLDTVESRRNMMYGIGALLLMLDVHLAVALDRWRARHGAAVRDWLEALGTFEGLTALASLSHDHPDWCFPDLVEDGSAVLKASALGHPLLSPETCVRNDVEVGPPGSFLLVTGSNMSGKSTLLRAIGANVALASAGGPVCAAALTLPPVRVHTSMRVDDSVTEGVSLFMAELLRIRGIVEAADAAGARVLYLLDEILHGTNTAERRVAARAVIRHLVAAGAIGAVSTHDLTLAQSPDLEAMAQSVHFREQVGREEGRTRLTFDYKLRPGLATTRNALKLLEAVGLGGLEGLEDAEGPPRGG